MVGLTKAEFKAAEVRGRDMLATELRASSVHYWMARGLARVAGQATSPAEARAARSNGAKGGRPRKAAQ